MDLKVARFVMLAFGASTISDLSAYTADAIVRLTASEPIVMVLILLSANAASSSNCEFTVAAVLTGVVFTGVVSTGVVFTGVVSTGTVLVAFAA